MMKKLLFISLALILAGCGLSKKDIFEMNIKCAKYLEEVRENECGNRPLTSCYIGSVFYSLKTNSCLYRKSSTYSVDDDLVTILVLKEVGAEKSKEYFDSSKSDNWGAFDKAVESYK